MHHGPFSVQAVTKRGGAAGSPAIATHTATHKATVDKAVDVAVETADVLIGVGY